MAKRKLKKVKTEQEKTLQEQLVHQMTTLATSGFGLVAALAWNDAIQTFVKEYIAKYFPQSAIWSRFLYAALITSFAVLITYQLSRIVSHVQKNSKKNR